MLISAGLDAIPPMMLAFHSAPSNYRVRLGVVYALAEILRRDSNKRLDISELLNDSDFPLLIKAASDDDKTIRLQATEFLSSLGDTRAVSGSLDAALTTSDNNKANNQVLILKNSGKDLDPSIQRNVANDLIHGPGPNNDVVKMFRAPNNAGPTDIIKLFKW